MSDHCEVSHLNKASKGVHWINEKGQFALLVNRNVEFIPGRFRPVWIERVKTDTETDTETDNFRPETNVSTKTK
jgi:hypothetical protein